MHQGEFEMKMKFLLVLGMLSFSGLTLAQNCGAGIPAGAPGCIPPDNPASPYASSYGASSQPQEPRVIWADRWGAVAIDNANSSLGAAVGMSSNREAQKVAIDECHAKGGGHGCEVKVVYNNQCAAIIWGDTGYNAVHAETLERASEIGMQSCNAKDKNCHIYYADCSMAERIQ